MKTKEATCDNCAKLYMAVRRNHYCDHCNKYFFICPSCEELLAKCRFCGVPLKKRREPNQIKKSSKRQSASI